MSTYLKISSGSAGSSNAGLRQSIIYIGKRYGKLAYKTGYTDKEYFKSGRFFVAKKLGLSLKTAILRMVEPKKIKGEANSRQWLFKKRIYGKAFGYIVDLLLKCPPEDEAYVEELLHRLYQDACQGGSPFEPLCSNALIYWQKDMLAIHQNSSNASFHERQEAGKILSSIAKGDKLLP